MYYSSGNYEAFARPKKPADVDNKHAYIIGTGLAALSAACYLVRDGQMPGENIHILEKDPVPGGACDGLDIPGLGYVMRGGREMDNHFELLAVPRHQESRQGRGAQGQVRAVRQGFDGNHEAVLHPGRRPV